MSGPGGLAPGLARVLESNVTERVLRGALRGADRAFDRAVPLPAMPALRPALAAAGLRPATELPSQIHLSVTDRCFLPCTHCTFWQNDTPDLPEATWARVIDELAAWTGPAAMNFVGGEPLLRKDLERLMGRAVRLGFTVTFNTNAWLLTEVRARALRDAGVSIAYLSLDGFLPATVDRSRGREGTHAKVMEVCDRLDALGGPRPVIACIVHADNAREIPDLLGWVRARGYELVAQPLYQDFGNVAHDPTWWRRSPIWPHRPEQLAEVHAALDVLVAERRAWGKVCNSVEQLLAFKDYFADPERGSPQVCKAGHSDLAFDPHGNVRLCYFLEPVGNLADGRPIREMWNSARAQRRRWEVHRCGRACKLLNCNFERVDG